MGIMPDQKRRYASFRARMWFVFQPLDLFTIPSAFLDGTDPPKHVCDHPRYRPYMTSDARMLTPFAVNVATYLLVDRSPNSRRPSQASLKVAVALLTWTAVIFRSEVALLLAPLCLQLLFTRRVPFLDLIRIGLLTGLLSICERHSKFQTPFLHFVQA